MAGLAQGNAVLLSCLQMNAHYHVGMEGRFTGVSKGSHVLSKSLQTFFGGFVCRFVTSSLCAASIIVWISESIASIT